MAKQLALPHTVYTSADLSDARIDARAKESRTFWERECAVVDLVKLLLFEECPPEVVRGLKDIADALIEARGFEPVFEETARAARTFVEIKRHPVAQR